jgi:hypothetical protein
MTELVGREESQAELLALAAKVSDQIQIREIILSKSSLSRTPDANTNDPDFEMNLEIPSYGAAKNEPNLLLSVLVNFRLRGHKSGSPVGEPAVEIDATYVILYTIATFDGIDQENLDAFAGLNGIFNAWPFWREYVRDISAKMGLGSITIPVYRVTKAVIRNSPHSP